MGIIEDLLARNADSVIDANRILKESASYLGDTDEQAAAVGYYVIRSCIFDPDNTDGELIFKIAHRYCFGQSKHNAALPHFTEIFVEPLYEHIDEQLDDRGAILSLLRKYKHKVEWFQRESLSNLWESNTQRGEKALAMNLYEFLYDQGVDLYIEPVSASGEADMVSSQVGAERLIADAKIFNPDKGKGKKYLAEGVHQIYIYTVDYSEPTGYLIVFNTSPHELNVVLNGESQSTPFFILNGKVIFIVTINIHPHDKSASKRGTLRVYELTGDYLMEGLSEKEKASSE